MLQTPSKGLCAYQLKQASYAPEGSLRGDPSRQTGGGGYYSHYFLTTKRTGSFRSILNLRGLNAYLLMKKKFRMETLASILQQGMWMISLDMKDAYHSTAQEVSEIRVRDKQGILRVYQWGVLSFGLATAPRVFTKLLTPIAAHLHLRNMSMCPYTEDIFHVQISRDSVILTRDASVRLHFQLGFVINLRLHFQLGFVINLAKSSLFPSQLMTHLGAWIDTLNGLADKVQEINQVSADLLANDFVSAGRLQSVGLMAPCHATVPLCLFRLRPLSSHLSRNFKWRSDSIRKFIPLDVPEVMEALQFWSDPSRVTEDVPLGYQPSCQTLTTDASSYGWGAVLDGNRSSGRWTLQESKYHTKVLEIMAVFRAILQFQERRSPGSNRQHHSPAVLSEWGGGGGQVPV